MTAVDPLLVAEIEVAMRLPVCANPGCTGPGDWTLKGEPYVCPRDDVHGWWAEFRWETTR